MGDSGDSRRSQSRRARWAAGALALACSALAGGLANGAGGATASDTLGKSTETQRIVPGSGDGFRQLGLGPGEARMVREDAIGKAQAGRATRRESLVYFGQLSDFQLADEESPSRVEFIDTGPFSAAWRPSEAANPQIDDAMIRQFNLFATGSPVTGIGGTRRTMDFTIDTGDSADSQQLNETRWVRTLLEGGTLDPGSGIDPTESDDPFCVASAPLIADADAPQNYTGVQDFDDYDEGGAPQFYDPDEPLGAYADWPEYPGFMDRAQQPFEAAGLAAPSYVVFGNHDALVQGNAAANSGYEAVATGCVKPMSPVVTDSSLGDALSSLSPANLQSLLTSDPSSVALVPPDPARQYVSKEQYKQVFEQGSQPDGHGFGYVDPAQEAASGGAAGYYAWSPVPGFRFIALDTVSEAGVIGPSADGNVDDPQYQWLKGQLDEATAQKQLVVLFSHHAIPSLTADVPDEAAPPCGGTDEHGHGTNPGCDVDPRDSAPIHLGDDLVALLHRVPRRDRLGRGPLARQHDRALSGTPSGGGFWSIRVAAEADWPQQGRLLEVFDNQDGTLSIFGTIVDHAGPATAPTPGADASGFDVDSIASAGRTLSYNDPQAGGRACDGPAAARARPTIATSSC